MPWARAEKRMKGERDMQDRNLEILSVITIIVLVAAWAALVI